MQSEDKIFSRREALATLGAAGTGFLGLTGVSGKADAQPIQICSIESDEVGTQQQCGGGGGDGSTDGDINSFQDHHKVTESIKSGVRFTQDVGVRVEYWGTSELESRDPVQYFHDIAIYGQGGFRRNGEAQSDMGSQTRTIYNNGEGTIMTPTGLTDQRGVSPAPEKYEKKAAQNQAIVDGFFALIGTMNPAIGAVVSAESVVDSLYQPTDKDLGDAEQTTWSYGQYNLDEGSFVSDTSNFVRFALINENPHDFSITAEQSLPGTNASDSGISASITCKSGTSYSTQSVDTVQVPVSQYPEGHPVRVEAEGEYVTKILNSPNFQVE